MSKSVCLTGKCYLSKGDNIHKSEALKSTGMTNEH